MRRLDDTRYSRRLARAEQEAAPHLVALGLADEPDGFAPFDSAELRMDTPATEGLADIPDDVVPSVRIELLRRIAESDIATAQSTHALVRSRLAAPGSMSIEDLELELALCRFAADLGSGIALSWMRVSLLDLTLDDLARVQPGAVSQGLREESEQLIELLANDTLSMATDSLDRRLRLLLFLQRIDGGPLPASAFDPADPFGEAMRTIVGSDAGLARSLGPLLPIAARASSVVPTRRQRTSLEALIGDERRAQGLGDAVARCAQQLLTAPLSPKGPGFVTLRHSNQRLARVVLWAVPHVLPQQAPSLLGDLGVRLGTSGKHDNQARDVALANSCARLLGELDGDVAVASLARMLARVRNKPVRKQVDKILSATAGRRGLTTEELVEASLPTFGVDGDGRRRMPIGTWAAEIALEHDGRIGVAWCGSDGVAHDEPPPILRHRYPGEVADVDHVVDEIKTALRDDRRRLEGLLGEDRAWPIGSWRRRFIEHPVGRVHGRRLIWRFISQGEKKDAIPLGDGLMGLDGEPIIEPSGDALVRLWHPVDSPAGEVDAWRDRLVEHRIVQAFKQAFRETYRPIGEPDAMLDTRFSHRPLAYGQLRALLGARGWSAPMLGPFDQGDRSVAYRDFGGPRLRAEFVHIPAGSSDPHERVEFARSGSVRFTRHETDEPTPLLLRDVPPRPYSEVLRDIDLFTSVPDLLRFARPTADAESTPLIASRADALRRIIPTLRVAQSLSVVGLWLRVERGGGAWAISLADGTTLNLPDEEPVEVAVDETLEAVGFVPFEDETLTRVLAIAVALAHEAYFR